MPQMFSQSSVSALALLFAVFLAHRALRFVVNRFTSDIRHVPKAPGGNWLWGNELEPLSKPCGEVYAAWFEKLGPIVRMRGAFGCGDILVVADPGALSHILTKNPYMYGRSVYTRPLIARVVGKGLVWAEGEEHKKMRALLSPVFTAERTRHMYESVKVCTDSVSVPILRTFPYCHFILLPPASIVLDGFCTCKSCK